MQYLGEFVTIALVAFLGAVSPGPDFVMVSKNSLSHNRTIGFFTALGIGSGTIVHIFYTLIGIGLIVSQSIVAYSMIKYFGAAYLIYLGIKGLKSKAPKQSAEKINKKERVISSSKAFKQGFLCNALNPKATVFFLSVFTQVIDPTTPLSIQLIFGLENIIIITMWFSLVAVLFSNGWLKARIQSVQHWIERFMGAVLILLGFKIATESR